VCVCVCVSAYMCVCEWVRVEHKCTCTCRCLFFFPRCFLSNLLLCVLILVTPRVCVCVCVCVCVLLSSLSLFVVGFENPELVEHILSIRSDRELSEYIHGFLGNDAKITLFVSNLTKRKAALKEEKKRMPPVFVRMCVCVCVFVCVLSRSESQTVPFAHSWLSRVVAIRSHRHILLDSCARMWLRVANARILPPATVLLSTRNTSSNSSTAPLTHLYTLLFFLVVCTCRASFTHISTHTHTHTHTHNSPVV
jgi:hypothetical protein